MQRLNFLYQASNYLTSLAATAGRVNSTTELGPQQVTPSDPRREAKRVDERPLATPAYLSRVYASSMKAIGKKTVVKLSVCSLLHAVSHDMLHPTGTLP